MSSSFFELVRRSNLNLVLIYRLFPKVLLDSAVLSVFCVTTMRPRVSPSVSASKQRPRVLETGPNQFDAQPLVEIFGRLNWHAAPSNADRRRAIYGHRSHRNNQMTPLGHGCNHQNPVMLLC